MNFQFICVDIILINLFIHLQKWTELLNKALKADC